MFRVRGFQNFHGINRLRTRPASSPGRTATSPRASGSASRVSRSRSLEKFSPCSRHGGTPSKTSRTTYGARKSLRIRVSFIANRQSQHKTIASSHFFRRQPAGTGIGRSSFEAWCSGVLWARLRVQLLVAAGRRLQGEGGAVAQAARVRPGPVDRGQCERSHAATLWRIFAACPRKSFLFNTGFIIRAERVPKNE